MCPVFRRTGALQVRFDLPATLLAFIQSRGRARVLASHVVLMREAGKTADRETVENVKLCAPLLSWNRRKYIRCVLHEVQATMALQQIGYLTRMQGNMSHKGHTAREFKI